MISANKAFKSQIRKVNYADIILRDGTVLNLEPSDFILGGFSMTDETTTGKFGIGSAVGKTISLTINNHTNKFSMYDFYKAMIYMYVSVTLEDGTVLKERKGKYYVINPSSPGDVITLSGVDSMHLFDRSYNASTAYPTTLQVILAECCLDCGVNIGFGQFDNYNFVVDKKPEECTYRQVVSWVAQIAGYNARINNNDYLELVWYDTSLLEQNILDGGKFFDYNEEDTYDGGDFTEYTDTVLCDGGNFTDPAPENVTRIKSISVSTDDVVITGVMVKHDDTEVLAGEEGYCITISDNDLVIGKESEIAQYLGDRLIGLQFRPLSCQIANNPLIEPMDVVYVYDRKGNAYFTLINSVSYSIGGFTTIACKAEDPIRNESSYTNKEAQAVVKARKEAKENLTNYDKAVQNMNMLAANAMGLYRESEELEDGSVIYYQSNRPIYKNEDGKCEFVIGAVVYKMTAEGFFVSTDGGLSYTSGFDANGNAVVNVLSAIGITFDWAKGGTLSLGGYDNRNGVIKIYDKNGINTGVIDNNGIALYAENGIQIILSPLTGLIQRDSDGNDFNGFVYEETVGGFSTYSKKKYDVTYTGIDNDSLKTTYEDKTETYYKDNPYVPFFRYYRKFTHWYEHKNAYFTGKVKFYSGYGITTISLPSAFRNKKWIIRVEQDEFDFSEIEEKEMKYNFSYDNELPKCYETGSITGEWLPYYDRTDSDFGVGILGTLTQDDSVISKLNARSETTKYLELPEIISGEESFYLTKEEIENNMDKITTNFSWVHSELLGTVTITAKCEIDLPNRPIININEFMRFRIHVVC